MAFKRFKTSYRLWLISSLVLFLIPCFLGVWQLLAAMYFFFVLHPDRYAEGLEILASILLYFVLPAILCGWVVQAFIVMVGDLIAKRSNHAA